MMTIVTRFGYTIQRRISNNDRGSVLATVLLVLIVLLTILLSVMTYALSRYGYHRRAQFELASSHLADASVQHYLQHSVSTEMYPDSISWSSPDGGLMSCYSSPWGAYRMIRAVGKSGAVETTRLYLVGSSPGRLFSNAIVAGDESQPLVVSGHVHVAGDIITGPQGVIRGRYEGESAPDESFLNGSTNIEGVVVLPQIDSNLLSVYLSDVSARLVHADLSIGTTHICDSADNSMPHSYTNVIAESDLVLEGAHWSITDRIFSVGARADIDIQGNSVVDGLIEMSCEHSIHIGDSASLNMAVLWAQDSIIIGGNAVFSGTAICPGTIVVKDDAHLKYPALLVSYNHTIEAEPGAAIQIRSHQVCEGSIVSCFNSPDQYNRDATIYIDTSCVLLGCILTPSKVDVRGNVWGSIVAEQFVFIQPPATYTNWIRNARIDRTRLRHIPELPMLSDSASTARIVAVRDVKP